MTMTMPKMSPRTTSLILAAVYALAVCFVASCALSACGASHREKTIKATLSTVNAVRDDFIALDGRAQMAIVDAAKTREEGVSRLEAYRAKRDVITQGFAVVYKAIAVAATTSGDPSVANMLDAAKKLQAAIDAVRKDFE